MKKVKNYIAHIGIKLIYWITDRLHLDLIDLAYRKAGIGNSHSLEASGESLLINKKIERILQKQPSVAFDIGANKGEYSSLLLKRFPDLRLYSFEPNPNTFDLLNKEVDSQNAKCYNFGFGSEQGTLPLFFDKNNSTSVQATSDIAILQEIAKTPAIEQVDIKIVTLDEFCETEKINHIDFIKIDTEGFELEVLQGARKLLNDNRISMIQFEFNEVNIIKRRFLKDFNDLLPNYAFYRVTSKGMVELKKWEPKQEIFQFQNILAVLKK